MTTNRDQESLDGTATADMGASSAIEGLPFATWADAPVSSNVRKERVRAALFHKLKPLQIGRFVLLEQLGAGAMGEIYAAYDGQLDRKVALKLVRSGSDSTLKADERLLREAQTLAQVSHPNVVQIYEAGTYDGRLFLAMELIQGKTLTAWLNDSRELPREQRQRELLRLYIAAGRGLEAAHAAGVAHRDFKPDNVLVGDDGRVRVVDFGLARALGDAPSGSSPWKPDVEAGEVSQDDLARGQTVTMASADTLHGSRPSNAATLDDLFSSDANTAERNPGEASSRPKAAMRLTETGTVMGTPFYMAPEQMNGAIADRRSDQFSFCVALYSALYDEFPFTGRSMRELRDAMESDRVAFAAGVPVPSQIRRALARGLSAEPSERFANMAELLGELEPKMLRLRGGTVAAAGLIVLLVVSVAVAALALHAAPVDPCAAAAAGIDAAWPADRQAATEAALRRGDPQLADAAWRGVKPRLDDYVSHWRGEAISACRATNVAHTQSAQQLDRRMLCLDRGRQQLTALVNELTTATPGVASHAVEAAEALPELESCSRVDDLMFGVAPPPTAVASQVSSVRDQIARAYTLELMGRYDDSLAVARDAATAADRLSYPPVRAEALTQMGRALSVRGTGEGYTEAERLYFDALDIAEATRHDQLTVQVWSRLVSLAMWRDSNMAQAHAWWRRNAAAVKRFGDDNYQQAKLHYLLSEIDYRESKYTEAVSEARQAIAKLGEATPRRMQLSSYYDALAKALERLDQYDEALQLHERALAIAKEVLSPNHLQVIKLQINYGRALEHHAQLDKARSVLLTALANIPIEDREVRLEAAQIHGFLSQVDYRVGHLDDAAEHARTSLQIYQRGQLPDQTKIAEAYTNLANVELRRRNLETALTLYQQALDTRHRVLGKEHHQVGISEGSIAEALIEMSRYDDALPHLTEAERIFRTGSSRSHWVDAWMLTLRGELLVGKRQFASAVPALEQALLDFGDGKDDPTTDAQAKWMLARALREQGSDPVRVRQLCMQALSTFTAQGSVDDYYRNQVTQFIAQLAPPQTHTQPTP